MSERYQPEDRAAWRHWLQNHYEREDGVWLVSSEQRASQCHARG